jgi:type IV secretory pathway ATPase VirB11/archaellum biosynthesis ATPase
MTANFPRWLVELEETLPVCGQFLLSGNTRDNYLIPLANREKSCPLISSVWECLSLRGFEFVLVYDPVRRLYLDAPNEDKWRSLDKLALTDVVTVTPADDVEARNRGDVSPLCLEGHLPDIFDRIINAPETQCAIIIDFASRLIPDVGNLSSEMTDFFVAIQKLSATATARRSRLFNPVLWIVDNERDLPDWFVVGNDRVRSISIPLPDIDARRRKAERLAAIFPDSESTDLSTVEKEKFVDQFAKLTDRLKMTSMSSIAMLAKAKGWPLREIADVVRRYKVGVPDNPWAQSERIEDIGHAEKDLKAKIHGQDHAIRRVSDILMRSVVGLTGAHSPSKAERPRGVLFFAGPTGVGKTMLAKAITKIVFGDEQAYIRFDMSEFSAEHSEARLIGAPPGYTGYDAGGQLVNAIRQRPFSVILFDEIEKAHPRILDKFLQILEDGRLTDGRGETVFFSEAIIIFTSNLGMYKEEIVGIDANSQAYIRDRVPLFDASNPPSYDDVQAAVRNGIKDHFTNELERPELLNRIGENFVIFDFIRKDVAFMIFDDMLTNIGLAVKEQHDIDVDFDLIKEPLREICTSSMEMGGRGIGNELESALINPLSRALFYSDSLKNGTGAIRIMSIGKNGTSYSLEIDEG